MLRECTARDKNPKIDLRTKDPANAGGNKNVGEENKVNKTV